MADFRKQMGKDATPANFICVAQQVKDGKGWMVDYRLDTYLAGKSEASLAKIREKGHDYVQSDIHLNHNTDGSVKGDFLTNGALDKFSEAGGKVVKSPEGDKAIAFVSGTVAKGKNGFHLTNVGASNRQWIPSTWEKAVNQAECGLAAQNAMKEYVKNQKEAEAVAEKAAPEVTAEAPAKKSYPKTKKAAPARRMPKGVDEIVAKSEASAEVESPEL